MWAQSGMINILREPQSQLCDILCLWPDLEGKGMGGEHVLQASGPMCLCARVSESQDCAQRTKIMSHHLVRPSVQGNLMARGQGGS